MRKERKQETAFRASGDKTTADKYKQRINELTKRYEDMTSSLGLQRTKERMRVIKSVKKIDKEDIFDYNEIKTVAANNLIVSDISKHAKNRAIEREVSIEDIVAALHNPIDIKPIVIDGYGRKSQRFIGEKATVNVNPDSGMISTVWKTGKIARKKYGEKGD